MRSSPQVIFDPSLLTRGTIDETLYAARSNPEFSFYIPRSFYDALIQDQQEGRWQDIAKFFDSYSEFEEPDKIRRYIDSNENVQLFHADASSRESDSENELTEKTELFDQLIYKYEYNRILSAVTTNKHGVYQDSSSPVADVLFEELVFSAEQSPIFSRLRKPLDKISKVGSKVRLNEEDLNEISERLRTCAEAQVDNALDFKEVIRLLLKSKRTDLKLKYSMVGLYKKAFHEEIPGLNYVAESFSNLPTTSMGIGIQAINPDLAPLWASAGLLLLDP